MEGSEIKMRTFLAIWLIALGNRITELAMYYTHMKLDDHIPWLAVALLLLGLAMCITQDLKELSN